MAHGRLQQSLAPTLIGTGRRAAQTGGARTHALTRRAACRSWRLPQGQYGPFGTGRRRMHAHGNIPLQIGPAEAAHTLLHDYRWTSTALPGHPLLLWGDELPPVRMPERQLGKKTVSLLGIRCSCWHKRFLPVNFCLLGGRLQQPPLAHCWRHNTAVAWTVHKQRRLVTCSHLSARTVRAGCAPEPTLPTGS